MPIFIHHILLTMFNILKDGPNTVQNISHTFKIVQTLSKLVKRLERRREVKSYIGKIKRQTDEEKEMGKYSLEKTKRKLKERLWKIKRKRKEKFERRK